VAKIRAKGRYGAVDNYRGQGLAAAGEAAAIKKRRLPDYSKPGKRRKNT
jgi:hypothetical protein